MAAPLKFSAMLSMVNTLLSGRAIVNRTAFPLIQHTCGKKTKAGGSASNMTGRVKKKHRKLFHQDGGFVYKGELLCRQLGLNFYPGENVGAQKNNSLYALRDGRVVVSCEKLNPYPDSPLYERVKNGLTIHKKFMNIDPVPLKAKFKLVSKV